MPRGAFAANPRGLAGSGVIVAAMLIALAAPAFGLPAVMPVAAGVTGVSLWMLAVGVWLAAKAPRPGAQSG